MHVRFFFSGDENPFYIDDLEKIKYVELAKPSYWDKDAKRNVSPIVEQVFTDGKSLSEILSGK